MKSIVLGAGCFWCTEASFQMIKGVTEVQPGYAGGTTPYPTYDQVVYGETGHVEVAKVDYDPNIVDLKTILDVFWLIHDPTSLNRQGADYGSQYASAIFYDESDKEAVEQSLMQVSKSHDKKIVTRVEALTDFYPAEDYHKNYYRNNPDAGYCQVVINPKLQKIRDAMPDALSS